MSKKVAAVMVNRVFGNGKKEKEMLEGNSAVHLTPVEIREAVFRVKGTAPYLQLCFSEKAKNKMASIQQEGEKSKARKRREARDFDDDYKHCTHKLADGGYGIPAIAFKASMVSACRLAGVPMTRAKLLFHVVGDGIDASSGDPLIRIEGEPEQHIAPVRNANGSADLRVRAIWREWSAVVRVQYDASCIDEVDVMNLLYRAGKQVGVGEGRPDSKKSCGLGFGTFEVSVEE